MPSFRPCWLGEPAMDSVLRFAGFRNQGMDGLTGLSGNSGGQGSWTRETGKELFHPAMESVIKRKGNRQQEDEDNRSGLGG